MPATRRTRSRKTTRTATTRKRPRRKTTTRAATTRSRRKTTTRAATTSSRRGAKKYGKAAEKTVASAMRRRKRGTLRSGSGVKVKSRKQAIAIGLSEARAKGAKVPRQKK